MKDSTQNAVLLVPVNALVSAKTNWSQNCCNSTVLIEGNRYFYNQGHKKQICLKPRGF